MIEKPCGVCSNCKKLETLKHLILRATNPPFSHADDDVVAVWNDGVQYYRCQEPMQLFYLSESEREVALSQVRQKDRLICDHRRGEKHVIDKETWLFLDADAEGLTWRGVMVFPDGSKILRGVTPELLQNPRRF